MITRRNFIKALLAGAVLFPNTNVFASKKPERVLTMYNIHTGESLVEQYFSGGQYDQDSLKRIHYFLRCHYTNEVREIDVNLLDLLCDIKDTVGKNREIQIISGYRSVIYNAFLANQGRHVSRNSLHLQGLAIDFTVDGITNQRLAELARSFSSGGVGKYPEFVHIDVGRVRYW